LRKIKFQEYNKKRKAARIDLLQIRDELNFCSDGDFKNRDAEKRDLLYKLAKRKKRRMLKKIGERKYRFKSEGE